MDGKGIAFEYLPVKPGNGYGFRFIQLTDAEPAATADAIEFLTAVLGGAKQLKISQIEHEARAAGLLRANQTLTQSRVLRDARMAMGLAIIREGADNGAWVWAKSGASVQPTAAVASPSLQPAQTQKVLAVANG